MSVIDARKRYDQTYRQRWVIKEVSDTRSFDEIKNTKMTLLRLQIKTIRQKIFYR